MESAQFEMLCRTVSCIECPVDSFLHSLDMTQILALLTMERPKSFSSDDLCDQKVSIIHAN